MEQRTEKCHIIKVIRMIYLCIVPSLKLTQYHREDYSLELSFCSKRWTYSQAYFCLSWETLEVLIQLDN